jgi:hypothetical protein
MAWSFAKDRARQDAGRSLRDAGAPRGEFILRFRSLIDGLVIRERPRPAGCRAQPAGRRRSPGRIHPTLSLAKKAGEDM